MANLIKKSFCSSLLSLVLFRAYRAKASVSPHGVFGSFALIVFMTVVATNYGLVANVMLLSAHAGNPPLVIPGKVVRCSDESFSQTIRYRVDDSGEQPVLRSLDTGRFNKSILSISIVRHVRSPRVSIRIRTYTADGVVRDTVNGSLRVCRPPSGPSPDNSGVLRFEATSGAAWQSRVSIYSSMDPAEVGFHDIKLSPAN